MITINLLPQEFRVQPKSNEYERYIKIGILAGALFLVLTAWFYVDLLFTRTRLKKIQSEWAQLQPQSAELKKLEEEVEKTLKPEKNFLESFVTAQKSLTGFMTWASEFLPEKVWLTEFQLDRRQEGGHLFFKGLAIPSKEKTSIEFIEIYLHDLKTKMPEAELSLTTTRQMLEETEVTQFLAHFEWGGKAKA